MDDRVLRELFPPARLIAAMVDTIGQHGYEDISDEQLVEIERLLTPFFVPRARADVALDRDPCAASGTEALRRPA